ncbi:MAG: transposase, partial [Vibrio metschnikovii]
AENNYEWPVTATGHYRLSIWSHFQMGEANGMTQTQVSQHLEKVMGRTAATMRTSYHSIVKALEDTNAFDVYSTVSDESEQAEVIRETLNSYLNEDGSVKSNPTYIQYVRDIHKTCVEHGLTKAARGTITKYTYQFEWCFRDPTTVTKLEDPATMVKRVDFAKKLKLMIVDDTTKLIWMDEMSFHVHKGRAKRLMPQGSDKVFFGSITPAKSPALNITTYMTSDSLINMHFKWESTDNVEFEAELEKSLTIADQEDPTSIPFTIVLDNARYHKEEVLGRVIERVQKRYTDKNQQPRQITWCFIAPNRPDLNLTESFNRHYKATLRRALDMFDYLTIQRPDRRGRPRIHPAKGPVKPCKTITAFSQVNLVALAKYVYMRIAQEEHEIGTWYTATNHVLKWADALIEKNGNWKLAANAVSKNKRVNIARLGNEGRVTGSKSKTVKSSRLNQQMFNNAKSPTVIQFTSDEVNMRAVEFGTDAPAAPIPEDEDITEEQWDDIDSDMESGDDEDDEDDYDYDTDDDDSDYDYEVEYERPSVSEQKPVKRSPQKKKQPTPKKQRR